MKHFLALLAVAVAVSFAQGGIDFDAGADLRIRQELMENAPGLPNGGLLMRARRGAFTDHVRFRSRVWGEMKWKTEKTGNWRVYVRLADEMRWCPEPYKNTHTFPDELVIDNLFIEGKGLFDGFLDLKIGRQDFYGLYGLDHVFVDGTPGDGSRTTYGDLAGITFNFTSESKLDLFALYDFDDCDVRWGTDRSRHTVLAGLDPAASPDMDDWGFGAVWGSNLAKWLPYQAFVMQKNTQAFKDSHGVEHPWTQRELIGAKLVPQLDEEWSLQFEGMGQVGCDGDGATLSGWSTYAGVNWKKATDSTWKPFGKFGYHFMSGDDDAADETGGHSAWDPMWARGVNDSELFLYGTHYGAAWWSNMHYVKATIGMDLGRHHRIEGSSGPLFAAAQDGMGGGDGMFKGLLSQVRYNFPVWLADKTKGERFEVFGHFLAEFFNPGDYYETEKPAFFVRWQVEFRF